MNKKLIGYTAGCLVVIIAVLAFLSHISRENNIGSNTGDLSSLPSSGVSSTGTTGAASDDAAARTAIQAYYAALSAKDAPAARTLLSPQLQLLLTESNLKTGAEGIQSISITSMSATAETNGIVSEKTTFDVTPQPGATTSWTKGTNTRYIAVAMLGGTWRILKIGTTPIDLLNPTDTQQSMRGELTAMDEGKTTTYPVGAQFFLILDGTAYPQKDLSVNCTPSAAVKNVPDAPAPTKPFYAMPYEVTAPGACTFKNGAWSTAIKIVSE